MLACNDRLRWLLVGCLAAGCGDDGVTASGDGSTGGGDGSGGASADATGPGSADAGSAGSDGTGPSNDTDPTCSDDADCDDGNACTIDRCDGGLCGIEAAVASNECRPRIDVTYPPRAATIESGSPVVTVEGTVTSGAGDIASLTINGEAVTVGPDGSFAHDVDAATGGNTLVFEAIDELDVQRRRVQSFLWSTGYREPTMPTDGIADEGLKLYLDQQTLDDGNHALPADDLATLFGLALDNTDLSQFVDPTTPITSSVGYNIYLTSLGYAGTSVAVDGIDGGIGVLASIDGVDGDLVFDCTILACELAGGDGTGGVTVTSIEVSADLLVSVDGSQQLTVTPVNVATNVIGLDIYSNNPWTNFLLTVIEPFIIGGVVSDIEATLTDQVDALLGPALSTALAGLAPNAPLSFPNLLDPTTPITVDLVTDFSSTDFHDGVVPPNPSPPQGGVIALRGGGYAVDLVAPYDNLGIPDRAGCGAGGPDLQMPRAGALELGVTDDLLNSMLFGAWRGGLLEFDLPPGLVPRGGPVADLQIHISGMLAPTASDCADDGMARVHLGDLEISGSLVLGGDPIDFVAYSSMTVGLEYTPTASGVAIGITDVESIDTELTIAQDASLDAEPVLLLTLEQQLVDGIVGAIAAGGLGEIALPTIDLSAQLGLPAGSAVLDITTDTADRAPGGVVITGHL